jgi:poly(A) polymerase
MSAVNPEIAARLRELVQLWPPLAELARKFEKAGHQLYLVGGSVRDALLQREHGDEMDFTTDASPERVIEIVRGWADGPPVLVGIKFGTVGANKKGQRLEITTFRTERYAEDSRHPDVRPVSTIEEDLSRRDFTVNAMALKLPERTLVDPHGGLADLAARVLRTPLAPEVSFGDDPLRMLRAARFTATLNFHPTPELVAAMKSQRGRLKIVSAERIRDELSKTLAAPQPSKGLHLAAETGLCDIFLPELPALRLEQDPIHRHKDVYRHTLAVVDKLAATDVGEPDVVLRMAGLLHDVGKPPTRRYGPGGVSFHHHEVVGAQMAEKRLRALRFSNEFIADVVALVEMHLRFHTFSLGWTDSAVRRYVRDAGPLLDRLNRLVRADCTSRNPMKARQLARAMDELEARIAKLAAEEDLKRIRPPLNGHEVMSYLGVPPGPIVGRALNYLLEARLDQGEYTPQEAYRLLDAWAAEHGVPRRTVAPGD